MSEIPAAQIPQPKGFKVLCVVPEQSETYKDSILAKPDITKKNDEITSMVMQVVELGPEAFFNKERFPSGARCKVGDFIVTRAYAGTRFKIAERIYVLLDDDVIEATVQDPTGITRA